MEIIITEQHLSNILKEVKSKVDERDKIYQDENIVVVAPLNHSASCKYGAYTKWCTSVPSNDEHFNNYMQHGVLIYFIVRSPYKNSKKPEYKFAYYHPFDEEMEDAKGWYDMTDNQLGGRESRIDMNLIKFLIPDEVMVLVKDYIKKQKPIWNKRQKLKRIETAEYLMNDPDNTPIINNKDWYIGYRTIPMKYEDKLYSPLYVYVNHGQHLTLIYLNKKTNDIYYQQLNYYIDLRNYGNSPKYKIPNIINSYNNNENEEIKSVFEKYYPEILKTYLKVRKEEYAPQERETFYLPPQYISPGKDVVPDYGANGVITNVYKDPKTNRYSVDTEQTKNIYYSDEYGVRIKYDKERHNQL